MPVDVAAGVKNETKNACDLRRGWYDGQSVRDGMRNGRDEDEARDFSQDFDWLSFGLRSLLKDA